MKNIHILPTDNPSRLHLQNGNLVLHRLQYTLVAHNIYITSDEEIKEGDYCIDGNDIYGPFEEGDIATVKFIKIIFTTDEQLIRYGVQAIDDEFLEWFVKNPSCEEIYVNKIESFDFTIDKYVYGYKIVVPSKDDLKIGDNTNFGIITDINEKSVCFGKNKLGVDVWYKKSYVVKFPNLVLEEPKQETLEEIPSKLDSVLAKISHQNDLGLSHWYEVVYYDIDNGKWCSYSGSKTFNDGERVVEWKYCKEIIC